jgi:DNA-binding LacI/PurR family transcriptional regulator
MNDSDDRCIRSSFDGLQEHDYAMSVLNVREDRLEERVATMREVASQAGVSIQTVSNVVNGRRQMSEATRIRVQQTIHDLGYAPNRHARQLRSRASQILAFIVVDPAERFLSDAFHDTVLAGISDALRDRNYCLVIQQVLDAGAHLDELAPLADLRVDGAVVTGSSSLRAPHRAGPSTQVRAGGIPLVFLEQEATAHPCCEIHADNHGGAAALVHHLVAHGHTRFAFVRGLGTWPAVTARFRGMQETLQEHGLRCDRVVTCAWEPMAAYQAVLPLLHAHPHLDAIIAANDVLALGAMRAVRQAGRAIPHDVAVAGFDDFEFSRCLVPALTTVQIPGYQMGRTAAEMILAYLDNGSFPQPQVSFPATLIVRESS